MKINSEEISTYISLKKPILLDFKEIKNFASNSIDEESTEEKKNDKEIKQNDCINIYINNNNNNESKLIKDISSKINITINNDDILQEQKLLNSKYLNLIFEEDKIPKKMIFSCKKRNHDVEDVITPGPETLEKNIKKEEVKKNEMGKKKKKTVYKKHDKMEKDNIVRKIQVHYFNFLINFINEVTQKIIIDETYRTKNAEEIIHMKDFLFNNIDYKFKSNIKKNFMEEVENMKIKDIISPSYDFCKLHNIINKNEQIMEKIELKNKSILNKILNQKYLYYFTEIYSKNKRNLDLKEENESINLVLSNKTKMFDDLIIKNSDDKNYISKMKRVVMQNFTKPKYMFKIKK